MPFLEVVFPPKAAESLSLELKTQELPREPHLMLVPATEHHVHQAEDADGNDGREQL